MDVKNPLPRDWCGVVFAEIPERFPEGHAARQAAPWDFCPPGGESYADAFRRVEAWTAELHRPTVAVAHGGVARVLRGDLHGLSSAETLALTIPQDRVFALRRGHEELF